jgi:hypothetical protein
VAAEEEARMRVRVCPTPDDPVIVHVLGRRSLDILRARDVSQTGFGIFVVHGFEECDIEAGVEIVVSLPGERTFLARGRVKHRTEAGDDSPFFGVHFTGIADEHRARIRRYVERRLEEEASQVDKV